MRRVAITGTIGSGKTEACNYIRRLGYKVFDCDEVNRQLLEKGNLGYIKVKEVFPDCFVNDELDKKLLADKVFENSDFRVILESIMHPLIFDELMKIDEPLLIAEVPLLFEKNWDEYFDNNLLIVTDRDLAIKRLSNRDICLDEAIRRINNQMSIEEKVKRADKIIYNNGSLDDLYASIDKWLKGLC